MLLVQGEAGRPERLRGLRGRRVRGLRAAVLPLRSALLLAVLRAQVSGGRAQRPQACSVPPESLNGVEFSWLCHMGLTLYIAITNILCEPGHLL